jgi:hypothetical protein
MDAGAVRHQDDGCGVLKDHSEDNIIGTFGVVDEDAGRAHAEVGSTFGHLEARIDAGATLAKRDFESIVAIKSFLDRRIIACELKLMFPFQLQRYLIQRERLCGGKKYESDCEAQREQHVAPMTQHLRCGHVEPHAHMSASQRCLPSSREFD